MNEKATHATIRDVFGVFWRETQKYPRLLVFSFILMGVGTGFSLLYPTYYKDFFDILGKGETTISARDQLISILVIILVVHFGEWCALRLATWCDAWISSRVMTDLRERSFEILFQHSHGFFANNFTGALVQKVNRLARSFERFFDRIYWALFPLAIRIAGVIAVLWFHIPLVAITILVWTVLFILVNVIFSRWKLQYDVERARQDSKTTAVLADAITNSSTVQFFTGRAFEFERFRITAEQYRRILLRTWNLNNVSDAIQFALFMFIEFLLFFFAVHAWYDGALSIGTFVLIQAYVIQLIGRLWDFGRTIRDLYESVADAKEMTVIMKTPFEVQDLPNAGELAVVRGKIRFQNVLFFYHTGRAVIDRLSFTIASGERVALVGSSGSGKSTIIKLLFRLYDIHSGSITVDGRNIAKVTQESVRAHIGFVPQEPVLFHRTLKENIRYGLRNATDEKVYEAARLAHCDEFIRSLPQGYDTLVGERGIKLSGGERQRVAIARVILKNAPILVLDEATSSLDSESEHLIQDALAHVMKGKTTIAIAHRLSTIRQMDRILVIDNGRIREEGSHTQLVKRSKSMYHTLWKLQSGGFLAE